MKDSDYSKLPLSKRRFRYITVSVAIAVISICITLWVIYGIGEETNTMQLNPGAKTKIVVNPDDILAAKQPKTSEEDFTLATSNTLNSDKIDGKRHYITVYPEWKQGNTTVGYADPVTSIGNYMRPIWSPIGLDVAFVSYDENNVYVIQPDKVATRIMPLISDVGFGKNISWNIDGMSLHLQLETEQALTLSLTGEISPAPNSPKKIWEQDGVIFWQNSQTQPPIRISGTNDYFQNPALSPDGKKVVYSGRETGLYITGLTGVEAGICEALSVGPGRNPSWLFDSRGIVYDIADTVGTSVIEGDLWYATADGKERTNITSTSNLSESCPVVSNDGKKIAFSSDGAIYIGEFSLFF